MTHQTPKRGRLRILAAVVLASLILDPLIPVGIVLAQQAPAVPQPAAPSAPGPIAPAVPGASGGQFPSGLGPVQPAQVPPPGQGPSPAAAPPRPDVPAGSRVPAEATTPPPAISPPATVPSGEEPASPIEASFSPPPGTVGFLARLRQFGYDLFRIPPSTFAPVEDVPVGPDYVLGPGDSLTIYVWGQVENIFTETVNRNGEIFIPRVGTLKIWGLTFEQAEKLIRDQLGRVYKGFRISVTLGRLRTIRVFVVGEVVRPGAYTLSALSTVTNALFAAGGPSKQGTMRRIRLQRNNRLIVELDFYDFLLQGDKSKDVRVESGDTVFVPAIGPVVGLVGNVVRPAIYELKGETKVTDLLGLAGGVSPSAYLRRVQLERFRGHTERIVLDFNLADYYQRGLADGNPSLQDGDLVRVFPVDPTIYNTVILEGTVKRPGRYELRPRMRVRDILTLEELLPEAYLNRAEIVRVKEDLGTEVIPFNLREALAGRPEANLELRPLDRIVISTEFRPVESVTISGQVRRPGRYAITRGERLSSLIERAGGFLPEAFPRGAVFTRESIRRVEREQLDKFVRAQEQALLSESAAITAGAAELSPASRGDVASSQAAAAAQRRELLRSLASGVAIGRMAIRVEAPARMKGTVDDILLEDGDALNIPPRPTSVLILGAVRNSTAVLHEADQPMEYYLNRAGGALKEADLEQAYILKPDGSAMAGYMKVRKIEAGDVIIVPISTEPKVRPIPLIRDIAMILGGFAVPIATIIALLD